MRLMRAALAPVLSLVLLGAVASASGASTKAAVRPHKLPTIVIGNEGFTESYIMQDIYADLLKHAGYSVSLLPQASSSRTEEIPALEKGSVDLVPDYAGSLLVYLNSKDEKQAGTLSTAISTANSILNKKGVTELAGTAGLDQNVFVVTDATKAKYKLTTIASVKPYASKFVFGAPPECSTYYFCLPGLKAVYGLDKGSAKFKQVKSLDESGPLSVTALKDGTAQIVELFSTDDVISADHFYVLQDNLNLEPADHLVPVIRTSDATTAVKKILASVNPYLTTSVLTQLVAAPSGPSHPTPAAVAAGFLAQEKLT